jgi:hypothetical protein
MKIMKYAIADPRMGSDGWNATACTVPRCPGSLYSTFPDDASHTKTFRQLDPAATRAPSGDHAHRRSAFSKPCACPAIVRSHRSPSQYGRTSQTRKEESAPFVSRCVPSGLKRMPVIVSACPRRVIAGTAFREIDATSSETLPDIARASQRLATSPTPPANTE